MPYFYPGETVTLGVGDLELDGAPVNTGATVTIQLFDPTGASASAVLSGQAVGNDWTVDVNLPASPLGRYTVKVTASKDGATWHGTRNDIWIRSF